MNFKQHSEKPSARYQDVDSDSAGQRIDNFLLGHLKGIPRSHVYRLIRSGQVRVNSGRVTARYRLQAGDRVRIPPVALKPQPAPVAGGTVDWLAERIVYEDSRLIVVDKPAGLAVHAGSGVDLGLIEALRCLRPGLKTLDLVHRLDRATSGCLLVAKRRSTLRTLHGMLREGGVEKRYLAVVKGSWQHGAGTIDLPLVSNRSAGEVRVRVAPEGKSARSRFRLLESFGTLASYLEVGIATGRTHQIRVHAAHLGHPIAGDERYGDAHFNERLAGVGLRRMFLHAHAVAFDWPDSDEHFSISVPLSGDLADVLRALEEDGGAARGALKAPRAGRGRPS